MTRFVSWGLVWGLVISGAVVSGCADPVPPVPAPPPPATPAVFGAADGSKVWFYEAGSHHVIFCAENTGCVKMGMR